MEINTETTHSKCLGIYSMYYYLLADCKPESSIINFRRIMNITAAIVEYSKLDLNKLQAFWGKIELYGRTKLCNILFTIELSRRLRGTAITTYSVHPGVIKTEFWQHMPRWMLFITHLVTGLLFKNSVEGAQTNIHCAISKGIETFSGEHFHDCHQVARYKSANDFTLANELWEKTERMVGL